MKRTRKTWTEKLDPKTEPKVVQLDKDLAGVPAGGSIFVPTPRIVEAYIRNIPKGTSVSLQTMRKDLAIAHQADATCPWTSGIFLRIVAEAAYEQLQAGKKAGEIAPFWRMIDAKSPASKKLSFGMDWVKAQRAKEKLSE